MFHDNQILVIVKNLLWQNDIDILILNFNFFENKIVFIIKCSSPLGNSWQIFKFFEYFVTTLTLIMKPRLAQDKRESCWE
jgi:hypothetical protein